MAWTKQILRDWLRLAFAPAKLQRALVEFYSQQNGEQNEQMQGVNGPQHWYEPLAELPLFWRKQLPEPAEKIVQRAWSWYRQESNYNRGFWLWNKSDYPDQLNTIAHPPWLLCWEGQEHLAHTNQIAIIGSRKASVQALQNTEYFATELALAGLTITSGLAMGIDSAAHWAALHQGKATCAVLGCGIDQCYPARSRGLKKEIQQHGLVISEYLPGTPAKPAHFPARNRIISGLSRGVLVVAAAKRSGSLITARLAAEQGKDVFAVPYSIQDISGEGCHWLIQQGAHLVTRAADILVDWQGLTPSFVRTTSAGVEEIALAGLETPAILVNVGFETTSLEYILQQSQLPITEVMNELVSLEIDGWVKAVPGGYVRVRG